jgi:hypothetical protein
VNVASGADTFSPRYCLTSAFFDRYVNTNAGTAGHMSSTAVKSFYQTLFLLAVLWVFGDIALRFTWFYWLAHQTALNICSAVEDPNTPRPEMAYIIPDFDRLGPGLTGVLRKLRRTAFDDCHTNFYPRDFFAEHAVVTAETLPKLAKAITKYANEATPYTVRFDFTQRLPDGGDQLVAQFYLRLEYRLFDNTYDFLRHYVFVAPYLALGYKEHPFLTPIENPVRRPIMMSYRGYYFFNVLTPDGFHDRYLPTENEP